ncbi:uncharacterized protein STEHIDRAFT_153207 [Stereum hirsutum FP-91666 SS1]|uniref:uncharacterized protein n=1 Tax=Stereum hirsutum (strain FP-91666) TaxID=721885 RepID=UPI000440AE22|nr:uncharacterized protein STEHIDRAFT_153207 [Stereum hirsutum FP-91666 SS1]EIM91576.1 hypothetical protein STEHIDRAFT_153207 [Stereum hirsutum FP-91666 SS1]
MSSITDISATPTPMPEARLVALHEGYEHQTATIIAVLQRTQEIAAELKSHIVASLDTRNPFIAEQIRDLQEQVNLLVSSIPITTPDDNTKAADTTVTPVVPPQQVNLLVSLIPSTTSDDNANAAMTPVVSPQHEVTSSVSDPDTRHTTPVTDLDMNRASTSRSSSITLVDRPSPPLIPSGTPSVTNIARASAPSPSPTLTAFMASSSTTPDPPSSTPDPSSSTPEASSSSPATSRPIRKLPARGAHKTQPQASYLAANPALAHLLPRAPKLPTPPSKKVSTKAKAKKYEEESDEEEEGKTIWGSKLGEYDLKALEEFADGREVIIITNNAGYESEEEEMEVDEPKGKGKGRGKKGTASTTGAVGRGKKRARDDENEQVQVDEQPAPVAEGKGGNRRTKRAKVSPPETAPAAKSRAKPKAAAKPKETTPATKPKAPTPATRGTPRAAAARKRA